MFRRLHDHISLSHFLAFVPTLTCSESSATMSSTSTLTMTNDAVQHGEVVHHEDKALKSPPATLQSVREPVNDDVFPEGVNQVSSSSGRSVEQMEVDDSEPPEGQAVEAKETWRNPRINTFRLAYIFLVSTITTTSDASFY